MAADDFEEKKSPDSPDGTSRPEKETGRKEKDVPEKGRSGLAKRAGQRPALPFKRKPPDPNRDG